MRNTDPEIGYFQKNETWSYLKRTLPIYLSLQFLQFVPTEIKNNEGNTFKTKTGKLPNFLSLLLF